MGHREGPYKHFSFSLVWFMTIMYVFVLRPAYPHHDPGVSLSYRYV